ncbi:relaxosome protein TraM [Budviciaceae bacterium BWR-B9]|uniref:Relaxosome protein TraM n=1 Tax=Limnobaculum allomyrinae TaxID=2791986 RepID=A0ABS1IUX4_9GAMM|nr:MULTISPECIES: conjugal transfer relaxosome DNA-binding protein TraM [Limnobaculum]MBK5145559.1 relaxosome protein TraM [Limnobaculum allomyrinae]MBV7693677.1 relaxosome protein TraM [Limnobaculum sp. M2-1]
MPKIQVFVTNEMYSKILSRVERKLEEGATERDANKSSEASKLIELGLRVQELQESRKESGFNQMEFNKEILRQLSITNASAQKILAISSNNEEIKGMSKFEFSLMMQEIKKYTDDMVGHFFAIEEGEE